MRPLLSDLTLLILTAPLAPSQSMDGGVTPTVEALAKFLEARGEQVARGAQLFDSACSDCHGDTALGFAEAVLSFPAEERLCIKCHRPTNPPQMAPEVMTARDAFNLGNPPPLAGERHSLAKYQNGFGLYSYVRATMPRWAPGSLDDTDYLAITAFLLEYSGTSLGDERLTEANAAQFRIGE